MRPLERRSLLPDWGLFALDSVQGYLELAEWYAKRQVVFSCDPADSERFDSMYFQLLQLEKDGLIIIEWEPGFHDGRNLVTLKQVSLTTAGDKLLGELRAKSRSGRLKDRFVTLAWAVVASVFTTLIVLAIKGG